MKKAIVVVGAVLVLLASMSSCKTHERCPAYGLVELVLPS